MKTCEIRMYTSFKEKDLKQIFDQSSNHREKRAIDQPSIMSLEVTIDQSVVWPPKMWIIWPMLIKARKDTPQPFVSKDNLFHAHFWHYRKISWLIRFISYCPQREEVVFSANFPDNSSCSSLSETINGKKYRSIFKNRGHFGSRSFANARCLHRPCKAFKYISLPRDQSTIIFVHGISVYL